MALNYNAPSPHCVDVLSEVIAPEATHLIAGDLRIQYDEALNVLRHEAAWGCGGMIVNRPDLLRRQIYICSS